MWRKFNGLCSTHIEPLLPSLSPSSIQLDGFYLAYPSIKRNRHLRGAKTESCVLLWALDDHNLKPVYWKFYRRLENSGTWKDFIKNMKECGINPEHLVHDGHPGITQATKRYWPQTKQQRCLVHLMSGMHKDLGVAPRTQIAIRLKQVVASLFDVTNEQEQKEWEKSWLDYGQTYEKKLLALQKGEVVHEQDMRMPKSLLGAFSVINDAYLRDELFTYLDSSKTVSRTTNAIESNNGNLRELLRRHRGMKLNQRINLVSWQLGFKQDQTITQLRGQIHTHFDT